MLKHLHTPSKRLPAWKTLLACSAATFLTACGGKSLNTKNAETFDASLKAMTANMDEAGRRKVAAAVILLADNADMSEIKLGKVQSATSDAGMLLSSEGGLFASRQDILGEMILSAEGRLNGKSSKDLISTYKAAEDNGIALELKGLNTALETIAKDEAGIATRKTEISDKEAELKAKEKDLIAKGHAYGRNFKLAKIRSATSRGIAGHGHATFKNMGTTPIDRPRAIIDVTWNADKSIMAESRLLNPGYDSNSSAVLKPGESKTFRYDFGLRLPLPEGTKHTKSVDDYSFNVSFAGARNPDDRSSISYRLSSQDTRYIQSVPNLIKRCDGVLDNAAKRKEAIEGKIKLLSDGNVDDLPYLSLRGNFTC